MRNKIDALEQKVKIKIEDSSNLHSLKAELEDITSHISENWLKDKYEVEKFKLDDKVDANWFTFIARKKEKYNELIQNLTTDNAKIDKSVKKAWQLIDLILHIDDDGSKIENALNKLAKGLIKIDGKEPDFWDVAVMDVPDNVSNFAEQIEEETKNEIFGSDSYITD